VVRHFRITVTPTTNMASFRIISASMIAKPSHAASVLVGSREWRWETGVLSIALRARSKRSNNTIDCNRFSGIEISPCSWRTGVLLRWLMSWRFIGRGKHQSADGGRRYVHEQSIKWEMSDGWQCQVSRYAGATQLVRSPSELWRRITFIANEIIDPTSESVAGRIKVLPFCASLPNSPR